MTSTLTTLALSGLLALGGPAYVGGAGDGAAAAVAAAEADGTAGAGRAAATEPARALDRVPGSVQADTLRGPGDAVPYVAQGPLLCGGAAAAMVERYWGALGVYADDYADLVSTEEGGIRTRALADAVERQGLAVRVRRHDPAGALARVRADTPVVALLETGASRYHYVVVVAAGPDQVRYHDPLKGPGLAMDRAAFLDRWAPSSYWTLVAAPGTTAPAQADGAPGDTLARAGAEPRKGGEARTEAGERAEAEELAEGEQRAEGALPRALDDGMAALRAGRPAAAADRVAAYLETAPPDDPHHELAWQMLASARYLAGDRAGALAAWNRIGEPPVDLVRVRGLPGLRHPAAVELTGLGVREPLTAGGLRLAGRRLGQVPAVRRARVEYRPLRDGSVHVDAYVLERRRAPFGALDLTALGLGALVNRRAAMAFGPLLGVGERWRIRGAWRDAQRLAEGAVAVPSPPLGAVVTLRAGWTEERFDTAAAATAAGAHTRTWGTATARRWLTAGTRVGVTAGVERWDDGPRLARGGLSMLRTLADDRVRVGADLDGWVGPPGRFARGRAAARARAEAGSLAWTVVVGGSLASNGSPPTLWDGAGTGQLRAPLLRGHPLVRDGRITGALGRGLLHATLAWEWFTDVGPGRAALGLFVDGTRVWAPLAGRDDGPRDHLDPGVQLSVSDGDRQVAVSLARGDGWVVSARVDAGTLPWLTVP